MALRFQSCATGRKYAGVSRPRHSYYSRSCRDCRSWPNASWSGWQTGPGLKPHSATSARSLAAAAVLSSSGRIQNWDRIKVRPESGSQQGLIRPVLSSIVLLWHNASRREAPWHGGCRRYEPDNPNSHGMFLAIAGRPRTIDGGTGGCAGALRLTVYLYGLPCAYGLPYPYRRRVIAFANREPGRAGRCNRWHKQLRWHAQTLPSHARFPFSGIRSSPTSMTTRKKSTRYATCSCFYPRG